MDGGDEMDAAMSWSRDPAFRPEWAAADGMPFPEWWEVWLERSYERKGGRLS